ncbi:alpha/beta fold hydrolase [Gryllotalpicola protaetiae]|uniref:Alpha/beta fold hydrolase n=1 Tax=Gryllotalpicola protaetiae TaxID=2419771 RepID=A0A387BQM1_9MICO|nr:alpha/beta fold hydrolase [Gryllotalpicola protaetiae]AYG03297.1 alpha/beta fold hydrolase [Gryllotalpicola protaetiae]
MPFVQVPGARLYFETEGEAGAPALLLVHQGVATLRMWDEQVPAFAAGHFVIRYDARGFGATEADDVAFSPAADIRALLDHLGVAAVTIIANSQGGNFAFDFAVESPERVRGLMTIGSQCSGFPELSLAPDEKEQFDELWALWGAADWPALNRRMVEIWNLRTGDASTPLDPVFVERAYALNAANLAHAGFQAQPTPVDPPAYERLGSLTMPVMVTVGEWDLTTEREHQRALAELIPGAEGHVFPGAAHLPSVQHPAEFEAFALAWLERHGL